MQFAASGCVDRLRFISAINVHLGMINNKNRSPVNKLRILYHIYRKINDTLAKTKTTTTTLSIRNVNKYWWCSIYDNRAIWPVSWIERIVATTLVARQNLRLRYAYDTTMLVNSHPVLSLLCFIDLRWVHVLLFNLSSPISLSASLLMQCTLFVLGDINLHHWQ